MTSKDLKHRVAIILSQSARNPIFYRDKQSAMSPLDVISRSPLEIMIESVRKAELEVLHSRQARDILIVDLGETELDNEQLLLLRTLYAQLPSRLKKAFVPVLFEQLTLENARLITHCILSLGRLLDLKALFLNRQMNANVICNVLHAVDEKLQMESKGFTDSDLNVLEKYIQPIRRMTYKSFNIRESRSWEEAKRMQVEYLGSISQRILKIRYLRLKKILLEGENPEINTDKEILVSRLGTLGFRREIADALTQLDKKLYQAGTPLDFKGCMDLIRTIYEEIIEDAAKNTADKTGKPPPDYPKKPFNPWNQYLKGKDILTADEHELTQKLYNYLSNAGAHRLGSAPEQARVAKNMVIELGLMILGRIQNLK